MNTIRVKRRRDDPPVSTLVVASNYSSGSSAGSTTKRRRTNATAKAPTIFRLQETIPSPTTSREPTVLSSVPQVVLTEPSSPQASPSRPIRRPVSKRSLLSSTTTSTDEAPSTPPETRRFHVARRIEATAGKRERSAVLMEGKRKRKRPVEGASDMHRRLEELKDTMDVDTGHERKKPHVHPLEKAEFQKKVEEEKKEDVKKTEADEEFEISDELEGMVLEYLKDHPAAVDALPPTPSKPTPQNKLGGGLGGGTWNAIDDIQDSDLSSDEDELGHKYVYDVYKRQTPAPEDMDVDMDAVAETKGKDWGILVLEDSDEEDFFLNAEDDGSDDGKWDSEDEDSNAEEYYKNEYPEEPSDDEDEWARDDSEDEDGYGASRPWETWKTGRRTHGDDEEYNLDDDSDYDEPRLPAGLPILPSMLPRNRD